MLHSFAVVQRLKAIVVGVTNNSRHARDRCRSAGPFALGCWVFGGTDWGSQAEDDSREAMAAAWDAGITHWDLALAYGAGRAEALCGEFLIGKRPLAFLASKGVPGPHPDSIDDALQQSLRNLQTDYLDLYYLHWPRSDVDLRPHMERLEAARSRGQIRAIGVSNFSPAQMDQVSEAGTIDCHQLCYSALWRRAEQDVIPYCMDHDIATAAYSPLAQGILAGRFPRTPEFEPSDARAGTVFFDRQVWPFVFETVETLKGLAHEIGRPLTHLAIRWVLQRSPIAVVVVGARNARQVWENVDALNEALTVDVVNRITAISDDLRRHMPDEGNIFRYYP